MLMVQGYKREMVWNFCVVALMNVILLGAAGCNAEPVRPILLLTGELVYGEKVSAFDSRLELKFSNVSVIITGREILDAFELTDGVFTLNKKILSRGSGLPVLDYDAYDDGVDSHRIHISVERDGDDAVISMNAGKALLRRVRGKGAELVPNSSPTTIEYFLDNKVLMLPNIGKMDLDKVLVGGEWRKINDIIYKGYDGVLEWQCVRQSYINEVASKNTESCYCNKDASPDDPTCWNYKRVAYVAFKQSAEYKKMDLVVFESNFSGDEVPFVPKDWVTPGEVHAYTLESEK